MAKKKTGNKFLDTGDYGVKKNKAEKQSSSSSSGKNKVEKATTVKNTNKAVKNYSSTNMGGSQYSVKNASNIKKQEQRTTTPKVNTNSVNNTVKNHSTTNMGGSQYSVANKVNKDLEQRRQSELDKNKQKREYTNEQMRNQKSGLDYDKKALDTRMTDLTKGTAKQIAGGHLTSLGHDSNDANEFKKSLDQMVLDGKIDQETADKNYESYLKSNTKANRDQDWKDTKLHKTFQKIEQKGIDLNAKGDAQVQKGMEGLKGGKKLLADAYTSGVGMLSDMAFGPAWAGSMMSRSFGNELNSKRGLVEKGIITEKEAENNAGLQALKEVGTEYMFTGFGLAKNLKGVGAFTESLDAMKGKALDNLTSKISNKILKNITYSGLKGLAGSLEEGVEEIAGGILEPRLSNLAYANKVDKRMENSFREGLLANSSDINTQIDYYVSQGYDRDSIVNAYAEQIMGEENYNDMYNSFLESGMGDKQAKKMATAMQDYMVANLNGDKKAMQKAENEMLAKYNDAFSIKEKFSAKDTFEAAASAMIMASLTGGVGNINTTAKGMIAKQTFSNVEGAMNAASAISNMAMGISDEKMAARAKAMYESAQNGNDLALEQYAELQDAIQKQTESDAYDSMVAQMTGTNLANKQRYFAKPQVEMAEDGSFSYIGEVTNQRASDIENKVRESFNQYSEAYGDVQSEDASNLASNITAIELGFINAEAVSNFTTNHPEARAIYESVTGVTLPETNQATRDFLFKRSAANYENTARLETINTVDSKKGQLDVQYANSFGSEGQEVFQNLSQNIGLENSTDYVAYATAMGKVYDAGVNGLSMEEAMRLAEDGYAISREDAEIMYKAGATDKAIKKSGGTVKYEVSDAAKIKSSEREAFGALARAFNVNIKVTDNLTTGGEVEEDGVKKSVGQQVNGQYDPKTNTITLNLNKDVRVNVGYTLMHEFTHSIKEHFPSEYDQFAKLFKERWENNVGAEEVARIIKAKQDAYKRVANQDLAEDEALEEIICDQMGEVLHDTEFLNKVAEENPDVAHALLYSIRDILRKIRDLFATYGGFPSKYNGAMLSQLDMLKEAETLLSQAMERASEIKTQEVFDRDSGVRDSVDKKYSIVESKKDGNIFVLIEENVFDAMMPDDKAYEYIKEFIAAEIGNNYKIFGEEKPVFIGKDLPNEFTQSEYTRQIKSKRLDLLNAKNQVANNLDEALYISSFIEWGANRKKKHKHDAKYGFYKYSTTFGIKQKNDRVRLFKANMLIRHAEDGNMYLYDVVDIKKAGSLLVSDIASLYGADAPQNYPTSTDTVSSTEADVNKNSIDTEYFDAIDSGDMDKVQRMVDEAAKRSGYTSPLLYHGSEAEFNEFEPNEFITEQNGLSQIKGYFGEDKEYSESYGNVREFYLKNTDNFFAFPEEALPLEEYPKWFEEHGVPGVVLDSSIPRDTLKGYVLEDGSKLYSKWEIIDSYNYWSGDGNFTEKIKEAGFDGIKWKEGFDENATAYMPFNKGDIKSADPVTYDDNGNIIPLSERFDETKDDIRWSVDSDVNESMTMEECRQMIQRCFVIGDIKEWHEGEYANGDEWIRGEGADAVALVAENDYNIQKKYLDKIDGLMEGDFFVEDILEAYLEGTLTGKEKAKAKRLDTSKGNGYRDDRFYAPQVIEDAREQYRIATQKITNSNRNAVTEARAKVLLFAHNEGAEYELGVTRAELNKKLRSWSGYSTEARDVSKRINLNVALENKWTGIENLSWVSRSAVELSELENLVASISGESSEYERNYIARTMLALDTHIDWTDINIEFTNRVSERNRNVRGTYYDKDRKILVKHDSPNTVAHEMGHALDHKWGRDLGFAVALTDLRNDRINKVEDPETKQFLTNFAIFLEGVTDNSSLHNEYAQRTNEAFARFVDKFVRWTEKVATGRDYMSEFGDYNDKFTTAQFVEFAKLLQEKAMLDSRKATKNPDKRFSLETLDGHDEDWYNHHGWVVVNEVLEPKEMSDFMNKVSEKQRLNRDWFKDLGNSRCGFLVGNSSSYCTLVISDGNYYHPSIEAVYTVFTSSEEEQEQVIQRIIAREVRYGSNRKAMQVIGSYFGNELVLGSRLGNFPDYESISRKFERRFGRPHYKTDRELQERKGSYKNAESKSVDDEFPRTEPKFSVDSEGNELSPGQTSFFEESKARDDNNNLLTLYSGTSTAGFNTFYVNDLIWLTTNVKSAASYAGTDPDNIYAPSKDDPEVETKKITYGKKAYYKNLMFDSEEDYSMFAEKFNIENYYTQSELDDDLYDADDYDELQHLHDEVWKEYVSYNRKAKRVMPINEIYWNADKYDLNSLKAVIYEIENGNVEFEEDFDLESFRDYFAFQYENYNDEDESFDDFINNNFDFSAYVRVPEGFEAEDKDIDDYSKVYKLYANVKNPYIVDNKGRRLNASGSIYYDAVEYALQHKDIYDGVIVRNVEVGVPGSGVGDMVGAFYPEQVKSVNNLNPTNDPDIRFSIPTQDELDDHQMNNPKDDMFLDGDISDEMKARRVKIQDEIAAELAHIIRKDVQYTHGKTLEVKSIKPQITELVRSTMANSENTNKEKRETTKMVMEAAQVLWRRYGTKRDAEGTLNLKRSELAELQRFVMDVSKDVVENTNYIDDSIYNEYQTMRDYIRSIRIEVPDRVKSDIDFAAYRRKNLGRMTLVNEHHGGTAIDVLWDDMKPVIASFVSEEFDLEEIDTQAEMFLAIESALDNTKAYRDAYASEFAQDLEMQFAKDFLNIVLTEGQAWKSFADKKQDYYNERTKQMKARHKEAMREQRMKFQKEIKEVKAEEREKRNIQRMKYLQKETERKQKAREQRQAKKDHKERMRSWKSIGRNYDSLVKKLNHPKKELGANIPEEFREALATVLKSFDLQTENSVKIEFKTGKVAKTTLAMRDLRDALSKIAPEDDSGVFLHNGAMFGAMEILVRDLNDRPLRDLNNSELDEIDVLLASIKHAIDNHNKLLVKGQKESQKSAGETIIREFQEKISKYGRGYNYTGAKGGIHKLLNTSMLTPGAFFKSLGGQMKQMYKNLRYAQDDYVRDMKYLREFFGDLFKPYQNKKKPGSAIEDWQNDKMAQTITLKNGSVIKMTVAQMMSLYCLSKRPQAMEHMITENKGRGIVLADVTSTKGVDKLLGQKQTNSASATAISYDDVVSIAGMLTKEQKHIADELQKLMNGKLQEWGNETSMQMYGIKLFTEENYFPIEVSDKEIATQIGNASGIKGNKISNFGFTKPLVENPDKAIVIGDIFDIVADHANKMALYHSYAAALTDFNRVFNYKSDVHPGVTVKSAIQEAYGQDAISFIDNLLADINGQAEARMDGVNDLYNIAFANYKKAAIGANLRVLVQQPTAIVRSLSMIDPKYFVGTPKNLIKERNEMHEHCPIAAWKAWGNYQNDYTRSLSDIMFNKDWNRFDTVTMGMYGYADDMTWAIIWGAVKNEVKDKHPGVKEGSEEFWILCNERASEVFDDTQVVDSVFHRSDAMRQNKTVTKIFTAFMAEPTKTYNMMRSQIVESYRMYQDGDKQGAARGLAKVTTVLILNAAAVSAAAAVIDAMRGKGDDDEDETWVETFLRNFWENFYGLGSNSDPLAMIVFCKDIEKLFIDAMDGNIFGGTQNMALEGWWKLAQGCAEFKNKVMTGEESFWVWMFGDPEKNTPGKFLSGLGYVTGIPTYTLVKDLKTVLNKFGLQVYAGDETETEKEKVGKKESRWFDYNRNPIYIQDGSGFDNFLNRFGYNLTEDEKAERQYKSDLKNYKKQVKNLSGEEKDKKVRELATSGYKDAITEGDYDTIRRMRQMVSDLGGDVDDFDEKVSKATVTAYKKCIGGDADDTRRMIQMRNYLLDQGWSEYKISSDIVYKSDAAREFKAACRSMDKDKMVETLRPLAAAGLTKDDAYKLYKNRNMGNFDKSTTGKLKWATEGTISSDYGYRNCPYHGYEMHEAIDIAAPLGTTVTASDGGTVIFAGYDGSGYGNYIRVQHANGVITQYSHLDYIDVRKGQNVGQGQYIGNVGSTGNSTGPHLDFRVEVNGQFVNPHDYLS